MKKPKTKERYTDRQRLMDYREAFSTHAGRRVLHDILLRCHFFGSTFDVAAANPQVMAFREGQRNVCLDILHFMNLKPSDIVDEVRPSVMDQFFQPEGDHPLDAERV